MIVRRRIGRMWATFIVGSGLLSGVGTLAAVSSAAAANPAPTALQLHPNDALGVEPGSAGTGTPSAVGWSSSNWSGYAETSAAPYTGVSSQWTVPTVTCSIGTAYSAAWLGIDGFNNNSLIQTGTEQDCSNRTASYSAWWTTSAQSFEEQAISSGCTTTSTGSCGSVHAGDTMSATISEDTSATGNISGGSNAGNSSSSGPADQTYGAGLQGLAGAPTKGSRFRVSSTATTVSVSPTSTTQGSPVSYSATVRGGTGTPSGTVAFATGSTSLCTATLSRGTGTCTATSAPIGTDTITGRYSGDASHSSSSGSASLTVTSAVSGSGTWTITLSDITQAWTFTETLAYTGPGTSAEWIIEAPSVGNRIATLANYGTTEFQLAAINGGSGNAGLTVGEAGDMVAGNGRTVISIPSAPDVAGDAFNISYGSAAPAPPS